ncbi:MAG: hypothetical protein ACLT3H_09250 [Roseburia sp.]
MKKLYCFTLDDNIRFFEDACQAGCTSIFDAPYLGMLKRCHDRFGCKFQLNMFYSYEPDSFSLADVPDCYRQELKSNSDWLKFSFHARHNDPPFPYETDDVSLLEDYLDVLRELIRIAGVESVAKTTTLHYAAATQAGCKLLQRFGVQGFIGMFYDKAGKEGLHYYLPPSKWDSLRRGTFYTDPETNLLFAHNDIILNQKDRDAVIQTLKGLDTLIVQNEHTHFVQLMTHEQYFYPDYINYQSDFEEKMTIALEFLQRNGYHSIFLEESCPL